MKKLSKEKQQQLILVALMTAGVIAGLWFGLIAPQKDKIKKITNSIAATEQQIDKIQAVAASTTQVEAALKNSGERLNSIEMGMPSGDLFSWIVRTVKTFNGPAYQVDMPQFGLPVSSQVTMLPSFPYNQAAVAVAGNAHYPEFGKFLADFENRFPHMRIQNLNLEPGGGASPEEREKLSFHMEIVTLVKTNSL